MFKVRIAELLTAIGEKRTEFFEVPVKYSDEIATIIAPITAKLTITNLGSMVLVAGEAQATVMLACNRCAKDYPEVVQGEVEQEFRSEDQLFQFDDSDREIGKEDLQFTIDAKGNIDIEELLREVILSNVPLKPVCPDCPEAVTYTAK